MLFLGLECRKYESVLKRVAPLEYANYCDHISPSNEISYQL